MLDEQRAVSRGRAAGPLRPRVLVLHTRVAQGRVLDEERAASLGRAIGAALSYQRVLP
jgi:hypothetical protein